MKRKGMLARLSRGAPSSVPEPRLRSLTGLLRLSIFAVLVFVGFSLLEGGDSFSMARYLARRQDLAAPLFTSVRFVGLYGLCVLGLVILYLHAWRAIRWPAYLVSVITVITYIGFKQFNGLGFTFHEASLIWSESEFIGDALSNASSGLVLPLLLAVALVVIFDGWARRFLPVFRSPLWLVVSIAAGVLTRDVLDRSHTKIYQLPVPYRVAMLAEHTYRHRVLYYGEREAPEFEPEAPPLADHILFIVDESVTGDMLHINGAPEDTTPFLDSIPDRLFNYGVISAPSNLSSTSNIILQSGLRLDQVPDRELRALKNPNLFSYVQQAGYRAHIIDGQIYSDKPTNLMTGFDLEKLDGHLYVRPREVGKPGHAMDMLAIDYIEEIVRDSDRSFIYFVKSGAHFPYDLQYPADQSFFEPTLSTGGSDKNLEKTLNSYRNALRWTVDSFMHRLFDRFEGSDESLIVIYTSDHGQSISSAVDDRGPTVQGVLSRWPHAVPIAPPAQQASVPLFLLGFTDEVDAGLRALYQPSLKNRVSAFSIFPSILQLTGYRYDEVRERYGPSIFDVDAGTDARRFVSGNLFGIGGGFYQNRLIRDTGYLNDFDTDTDSDTDRDADLD